MESNSNNSSNFNRYPIYFTRKYRSKRRRDIPFLRRLFPTPGGRPQLRPLSSPHLPPSALSILRGGWSSALLALCLAHTTTWLLFAALWRLLEAAHTTNYHHSRETSCLEGVQGWAGYLLFSIETQTGIGYGVRQPRGIGGSCSLGAALVGLQAVVGAAVGGAVMSIVYAKMSGPGRGGGKEVWSRKALICQRDGQFCLIFRVRDTMGRYQCRNNIRAYLLKGKQRRGDPLLISLNLRPYGMLMWPVEVVHQVTKDSPLWDVSARDLIMRRFEIIVTMLGESASTCITSSTSTSYLSKEILWGHRFKSCVEYSKKHHCYVVDHQLFNETEEVMTPLCSARRLQEVVEEVIDGDLESFFRDSSSPSDCTAPIIDPSSLVVTLTPPTPTDESNIDIDVHFRCDEDTTATTTTRIDSMKSEPINLTVENNRDEDREVIEEVVVEEKGEEKEEGSVLEEKDSKMVLNLIRDVGGDQSLSVAETGNIDNLLNSLQEFVSNQVSEGVDLEENSYLETSL